MATSTAFSLDMIRDDARMLVKNGVVGRQQPIYTLCQYISVREWETVELTLEQNGFLLRDRVIDLLGREDWDND
jgi:hypothetical protein